MTIRRRKDERRFIVMQAVIILGMIITGIGFLGFLLRRNIFNILISLEVMLNGVNLIFLGFSKSVVSFEGDVIVLFIIAIAAAEAVVGLGIAVLIFRNLNTTNIDELRALKG